MTEFEVVGNDDEGYELVDLSDDTVLAEYEEQPAIPDDIVDDLLEEMQVGNPQKRFLSAMFGRSIRFRRR